MHTSFCWPGRRSRRRGVLVFSIVSILFVAACGDLDSRSYAAAMPASESALPTSSLPASVDWIRQIGSAHTDSADAVAVDGASVYVAGATDGALTGQKSVGQTDAFLQKYAADGELEWTRQFGTAVADRAHAVVARAGRVFVVGSTDGALDEEAGADTNDVFVRAYDAGGALAWTRQLDLSLAGTSLDDVARAVAASDDTLYVVGESTAPSANPSRTRTMAFIQTIDLEGNPGWSDQFFVDDRSSRAWDVAVNADGVYVSGDTPSTASAVLADWDGFVRRYDLDGHWKWTRVFDMNEQAGPDAAVGLGVDDTGVYVIGESFETVAEPRRTYYVRKLDADGAFVWTHILDEPPRALAVGRGGLFVASGSQPRLAAGRHAPARSVEVRRLTPTGELAWTRRLSASGPSEPTSVALSAAAVYVTGTSDGAFSNTKSVGSGDGFVVRLIEPLDDKQRRRR